MKKTYYGHLITLSILLAVLNTSVFAAAPKASDNFPNPVEYLQSLTPDQAQALQQTAQDRLNNLTPKQKKELMQTAQDYLNNISPAEKKALIELTEKDLNIVPLKESITENADKPASDQKQALKSLQQGTGNQKAQ